MNRESNSIDTEIDWIGTIPSHWKTEKIRYIFWERKELNNPIRNLNFSNIR